jgi:orotidine-5'-phosphate decarboxylase
MAVNEKLILALDVDDVSYATELIDKFMPYIGIFKVGLELFTVAGPSMVHEIQKRGRKVFLDLKFHDIPTTVSRAGVAAARLGVFMFNVHASGGLDMMNKRLPQGKYRQAEDPRGDRPHQCLPRCPQG